MDNITALHSLREVGRQKINIQPNQLSLMLEP